MEIPSPSIHIVCAKELVGAQRDERVAYAQQFDGPPPARGGDPYAVRYLLCKTVMVERRPIGDVAFRRQLVGQPELMDGKPSFWTASRGTIR